MQFYRELDNYSNRIVVRTLLGHQIQARKHCGGRLTSAASGRSICSPSAGSPAAHRYVQSALAGRFPYRNAPPGRP